MKAFSLDVVDISSNLLSNSEINQITYSELKSRLSTIDISNNPLQIQKDTPVNLQFLSGRIFKSSVLSTQPNASSKATVPIQCINLYNENEKASSSPAIQMISPNTNKEEMPLLLELEKMYQSKCKSNTTTKHHKINSEIKCPQYFSPISQEHQTPTRAIWSRWGKQRLSIPS